MNSKLFLLFLGSDFILTHLKGAEGIFRITPALKLVNQLQSSIDKDPNFKYDFEDATVPAVLVKRFFRDLNPRLLPDESDLNIQGIALFFFAFGEFVIHNEVLFSLLCTSIS